MNQKSVLYFLCRLFLMILPVSLALSNSWSGGVFPVQAKTMAKGASIALQVTQVNLTVTKSGTGSGTVTSSPVGIDCGATCAFDFDVDTVVTLTATADAGSTFTGWSGGGCSGTSTCIVTMSAATTVTANFDPQFTLTVSKTGTGTGTVTSSPVGIDCGLDCSESYNYNTQVTLTASATTGSTFTGWSGGGCSGTGTCVVTITAATTVTANFNVQTFLLTVSKTGTGTGTVTSAPVGIDCGSTCSQSFNYNTQVTLTASAAAGSVFTGWSGGGCSGSGTCIVTMTAVATVTANFDPQFTLTVSKTGAGSGTVTSNPAGINCGSTCSHSFNYNIQVTLTASASTGSTFTGWSGGGCSGTSPCTVTMTAATTVTANFDLQPRTLTVSKTGTGSGTVTSNPAGINCGATCSAPFPYGNPVILTATAATDSTFTGWSGGGCTGIGTCTVTPTAATTVTATFTMKTFTLTVNKAGTGQGTVTSSPAGIDCGSDCSQTYNYATQVTLTASAAAGSTFLGWNGGGCGGTGNCMVTMTAAATVSATFSDTTLPTVSWVLPVLNGQNLNVYNQTIQLQVSAGDNVAVSKVVFSRWDYVNLQNVEIGTVTTPPYQVNLNTSALLPAWNEIDAYAYDAAGNSSYQLIWLNHIILTVNKTGTGSGTVTSNPAGINCGLTCGYEFALNTKVTLTASPGAGSVFLGWSGGGCSGTGTCSVTVTAAATVTANFDLQTPMLTVAKTGTGSGTVTSGPLGINCGADCSEAFPFGTSVTLLAIPADNAAFTGWSGACSGSSYSCVVLMNAVKSVTASFTTMPTNTDIYVGGTKQASIYVPANQSMRRSFANLNNGPVKFVNTDTTSMLAAERVVYKVGGVNTSFSEMMGLPNNQLNTIYWLPWYNNVELDTQLRFGNVSGSNATVHVYIGGDEMPGSPFTLLPGDSRRQSFQGINNGPVKIQSNVNIVAAERVIYKVNGTNTSFTEMMALPNSQLNTTYWLPWYNNADLDTQLRFANLSTTQQATVHVYIGGQEVPGSPFILPIGGSTRQSFAGINNGPVKIQSNVNIVAAERVIYKVNGVNTSFAEMMALPNSQLNTTYWLPWYNDADLDTQLRFGNVTSSTAHVHVYVAGVEMSGSPFTLTNGQSTRVSFAGVNNGPVQIVSDQNIVAAERVIYKVNNTPTSFTEMMGLPNSQLNATFWLPWYNNLDLDTQLRFGLP